MSGEPWDSIFENDRIIVSWPATRLYDLVAAGNAKATVAETAALLKLDTAVVVDALVELHHVGIVPNAALKAALAESP